MGGSSFRSAVATQFFSFGDSLLAASEDESSSGFLAAGLPHREPASVPSKVVEAGSFGFPKVHFVLEAEGRRTLSVQFQRKHSGGALLTAFGPKASFVPRRRKLVVLDFVGCTAKLMQMVLASCWYSSIATIVRGILRLPPLGPRPALFLLPPRGAQAESQPRRKARRWKLVDLDFLRCTAK